MSDTRTLTQEVCTGSDFLCLIRKPTLGEASKEVCSCCFCSHVVVVVVLFLLFSIFVVFLCFFFFYLLFPVGAGRKYMTRYKTRQVVDGKRLDEKIPHLFVVISQGNLHASTKAVT